MATEMMAEIDVMLKKKCFEIWRNKDSLKNRNSKDFFEQFERKINLEKEQTSD